MYILPTLALAVTTLAVALPEPAAITTRSICSKLSKPRCHNPAMNYCSSFVGTTTTTVTAADGGQATATELPSNFRCSGTQAKAKREAALAAAAAAASAKVPTCLKQISSKGGDAAVSTACACLGIYQSTATVTEGGGGTATVTNFKMQAASTGDASWGLQFVPGGETVDRTIFGAKFDDADTYTLNNQCNIVQIGSGKKGYSDPSKSTDDVYWYASGNTIPSSLELFTCAIGGQSGSSLGCRSGSNIENTHDGSNSAWVLTIDSQGPLHYDIFLQPVM